MNLTLKWYKRFCPVAVYKDDSILAYKKGQLYKIDVNGNITPAARISDSFSGRLKESGRLFSRLFRRDIKTSCITENEEVFFFKNGLLYRYDDTDRSLEKITETDSSKSTPLNIAPALADSGYKVLWGDYFSNEKREEVVIWGLTDDKKIRAVYRFLPGTVRHIHNIIKDVKGNGYYIFTGDNDKKAGIYYSDATFANVEPVFTGEQKARAVQGFCTDNGIIYATDSVSEQNYICTLEKKDGWEHKTLEKINGSCIYATSVGNKFYFSTTVESPETEGQNKIKAMLSTARGSGILSDNVELLSVDKNFTVKKVLEFKKDSKPYKLFQYGAVTFPASMSGRLVIYPVAVKKYDGKTGVSEGKDE